MTLPTLKFPLNGIPDQVEPCLVARQVGVNPAQHLSRDRERQPLGPKFFASHVFFRTYDIDDGLDISYVRNIGKRRDQMRKIQTLNDVKETFGKIKKADAREAMARAMLKHGNLTDEARSYVAGEFPVTLQQVYDALDHLRKNHRVQEVGPANLSPTKLNYIVDGVEITASELVAMASR